MTLPSACARFTIKMTLGDGRDYSPRMHLDLRGNVSAAESLNRGGVDRASADRAVFGE